MTAEERELVAALAALLDGDVELALATLRAIGLVSPPPEQPKIDA